MFEQQGHAAFVCLLFGVVPVECVYVCNAAFVCLFLVLFWPCVCVCVCVGHLCLFAISLSNRISIHTSHSQARSGHTVAQRRMKEQQARAAHSHRLFTPAVHTSG